MLKTVLVGGITLGLIGYSVLILWQHRLIVESWPELAIPVITMMFFWWTVKLSEDIAQSLERVAHEQA